MEIRELAKEEYGAALDLAWEVFQKFEAPDYTPQGSEAFYASIHDPDYLARLRIYSAFDGDALIGILATRSGGAHIALFFVRGTYHRQGVGEQLFFRACRENPTGQMTVNSSPYAVEVYRRLGFCETDAEQTTGGIRYTPMAFDFKKEYKEFYLPKNKPEIVTVPKANYIAVRGTGDPNEATGAYKAAVGVLYAVAYTIKMSKMGDYRMPQIKVEGLTFAYPGSYDNIFEDVSFQLDTDWKLGFVGRNGRGKTTLLKLLLGEYPYVGSISASVPFAYFPFR